MSEPKASLIDLKALQLQYAFEHGVNFGQRTITIVGEIDEKTFQLVDSALTEMEAESKASVTIRIHSPGGGFYDALAVVGRMRASKCQIITEGYGEVMSGAAAILAAGDKRRASKYSWFMWHEASTEIAGRHTELKSYMEQQEREAVQWARFMADHSHESIDYWLEEAKNGDKYLSAEELLEMGVIDEII